MFKFQKIISFLAITVLIISVTANVFAIQGTPKLEVVKSEATTVNFEAEQGNFTKKIINSNSETGEVTIELTLNNIIQPAQTEIMLVVDNSGSMLNATENGKSRKEVVHNANMQLVESIMEKVKNCKIGIISFEDSANQVSALSDDLATVKQGLISLLRTGAKGGTNIAAGLQKAKQSFSTATENKIIVLLTDGIPSSSSTYAETKQALQDNDVYIISMLTGLEDAASSTQQVIESIFGTQTNPTADKFYNIADSNIENIMKESIFNDVANAVTQNMTSIIANDYITQDIQNNFELTLDAPTLGEVTFENGIIQWKLEQLEQSSQAKLVYTLKAKDMNNREIQNKLINTNQKVEIQYQDTNKRELAYTQEDSPSIKITAIEIPDENNNENNNINEDSNNNTNVEDSNNVNIDLNNNTNVEDSNNVNIDLNNNTNVEDSNNVNIDLNNKQNDFNTNNQVNTSDKTATNNRLPQTGINDIILFLAIGITIVTAVIGFIQFRRYNY